MRNSPTVGGSENHDPEQWTKTMELPLFPLNVVLFPGMVLPLHIFEPRYREMINDCVEEKMPFGVVLHQEDKASDKVVVPHMIGTAARIMRVERQDDGRMNIATVGTQRFRIEELDYSHSYLSAKVTHFPVINGNTRAATEMAEHIQPRIMKYVELLAQATNSRLQLDRIPDDPTTLAFLIAIAIQVNNEDKQELLSIPGIPQMLAKEHHQVSREILLMEHMLETIDDVEEMNGGPTGYIFPN